MISTAHHKPEEYILYGEYKGNIHTNKDVIIMLENNGSDMYYALSITTHAIWAADCGGYI